MRILITGANGFVGKALCSEAATRNLIVRGVTRRKVELPHMVEHVLVDNVDSSTNWQAILLGCDVVVHLVARVHVMNELLDKPLQAFRDVNLHTTMNLAKQAATAGVKRFIFISSVKVNGEQTTHQAYRETDSPNPADHYGRTKYEAEEMLNELSKLSNMELVIIRPPLIYGKGVKANLYNLIRLCKIRFPLPLGAIHNLRSLIYIENLVDFIITCASHPLAANQTFLIADDDDVSTAQLIKDIRETFGKPAWLIPIPQKLIITTLRLIGKKSLANRLCGNLQVDISKAKTLLGWKPPYTFKQGIRKTIQ